MQPSLVFSSFLFVFSAHTLSKLLKLVLMGPVRVSFFPCSRLQNFLCLNQKALKINRVPFAHDETKFTGTPKKK